MARFRMGNEYEGCKFWKKEDDRVCRVCGNSVELVRHVFEECEGNNRKVKAEVALGELGEGIGYLKGMEWLRKRKIDSN